MAKIKKAITNQTSKEELQAKIADVDKEETPKTPEPEPEEVVVPDVEPETPPEPVKEPEAPPEPVKVVKEEEDEVDWKARYAGSTKEAQILAARDKDVMSAIDDAASLSEPTEEELRKEFGDDWELMDNFQKRIAKDNLLNKRRFERIDEVAQKRKKIDTWIDKVNDFVADPKTISAIPKLQGKETEFGQFCLAPSRVGVDFDVLVKAFLYDVKVETPTRPSSTLFEIGGGGEAPKTPEITPEQIAYLRKNNQKEYKRLLNSGKIKVEL